MQKPSFFAVHREIPPFKLLTCVKINILKLQFFLVTGKRGNRWSLATIRVGKYQIKINNVVFYLCFFFLLLNIQKLLM